jgi:hypothetical protein
MGQVQRAVDFPLGGDTERALDLPCQPASCQGGPLKELLLAAVRDVQLPEKCESPSWRYRWRLLRP